MLTRDFILAGRATFTVDNGKGQHFTYKVRGKLTDKKDSIFFISLLTGSDNLSDYTYMGVLTPTGAIRLTTKSKLTEDSLPVKVAKWAMNVIWERAVLPAGYNIRHEGRCARCGRTLTHPESLNSGIGPECATKIGAFTPTPCPQGSLF